MVEPENTMLPRPGEPWLMVPQSARAPERHRFGEPAAEEEDEDDEDLEFLESLARQAEREAEAQTRAARPARPRRFNVKADTSLDVFKETTVEQPRPRVLRNVRVDPVEMDDLLEQLSTTAAALRQRRAA
ncbi:MAG TPA: hypothetical protein VJP07_08885 [Dehalococcoidia bacterium]|nr:hypothetical protein [Dehalococcoidia bacterium]